MGCISVSISAVCDFSGSRIPRSGMAEPLVMQLGCVIGGIVIILLSEYKKVSLHPCVFADTWF